MPREVIEFRGQSYPDRCSHCLATIGDSATILLGTKLIFCDDSCLDSFVNGRAAYITIKAEVTIKCMLS